MDDVQTGGADGGAGLGNFDDRIDESLGGFRFGGTPGKFHFHGNVPLGKIRFW